MYGSTDVRWIVLHTLMPNRTYECQLGMAFSINLGAVAINPAVVATVNVNFNAARQFYYVM